MIYEPLLMSCLIRRIKVVLTANWVSDAASSLRSYQRAYVVVIGPLSGYEHVVPGAKHRPSWDHSDLLDFQICGTLSAVA